MSGDSALRVRVPCDPLELHLALKNMRVSKNAHYRVLESEVCQALPRGAFGVSALRFFCAICSHRLAPALTSPPLRRGAPSCVVSQYLVKNTAT